MDHYESAHAWANRMLDEQQARHDAMKAKLEAMQPGDVFYWGSIRHTFVRRFYLGGITSTVSGMRSSGQVWSYTFTPRFIETVTRVVSKEKTRTRSKRNQYAFAASTPRPESFKGETNDCTVRALVAALGITYEAAHAFMESHGRKNGRGARSGMIYNRYNDGVQRLKAWTYSDMHAANELNVKTLGQWLKSGLLPKRAILSVHKHVLAVVDGVGVDTFKSGSRTKVQGIFEVMPVTFFDTPHKPWA